MSEGHVRFPTFAHVLQGVHRMSPLVNKPEVPCLLVPVHDDLNPQDGENQFEETKPQDGMVHRSLQQHAAGIHRLRGDLQGKLHLGMQTQSLIMKATASMAVCPWRSLAWQKP